MPNETSTAIVPARGWAVVSDLDGTLLDDHYDLSQASRVLNELVASSFDVRMLALASSKTLPEMLLLAALCDQSPVLIFENGAGRAVPLANLPADFSGPRIDSGVGVEYGIQIEGIEYANVCELLQQLRDEHDYQFTGFADMPAVQLAAITGLSLSGAMLARDRNASEPILWQGTDVEFAEFVDHLAEQNLQAVAGGRFLHVSSRHDKAASFADCLQMCAPGARVLACGDAPNDRALLEQADHALVFPGRTGRYLLSESATTSHSPAAGGEAWLRCVLDVLAAYQNQLKDNVHE